jgi:hypothetical protein
MTEDYGKQMNIALRAVEQMHSDCSRLLLDFDRKMEGWAPIFGSYATRDLTYNVRAQRWMAEGVYRLYSNRSHPSVVRGLTISFIEPDTDQPLLLAAEIRYADQKSDIKTVCREWDIWGIFFDSGGRRIYDEILSSLVPDPTKRIGSAQLIAKPLYSIKSVDEIAELMKRVSK